MTNKLKQHLSIADQVSLLESRGLLIEDREAAEAFLERVNYYRFSGYLHDFKINKSDNYRAGVSFNHIARIYEFDTKFTRLLLYVLEDIEETLKTRFSYTLSSTYPEKPLIYLDSSIYRSKESFNTFKRLFEMSKNNNSGLPFIKHHINKYGGNLPIWVAVEIMTMGNVHSLYDNLIRRLQKNIAKKYHTGSMQLANWIENLTYTRNHLAHYMRIYNYSFGRIPMACNNHPMNAIYKGKIFDQIAIMSFMYSDPKEWNSYVLPEIEKLLNAYSDVINLDGLGFSEKWNDDLMVPE